jgi:hypothetical protein
MLVLGSFGSGCSGGMASLEELKLFKKALSNQLLNENMSNFIIN